MSLSLRVVRVAVLSLVSGAFAEWPIQSEGLPGSLPNVDVALAPPTKPLPEVVAEVGNLEKAVCRCSE